jgi:hypothetical protein
MAGLTNYLGYFPGSDPFYATDGRMTYLELLFAANGYPKCEWEGYCFLGYPP